MKKFALVVLALALLLTASGCFGPFVLSRGFDDWMNQQYVDNPIMANVLMFTGIAPVAMLGAALADLLVTNPIKFVGEDLFRGKGTPFHHINPVMEKEEKKDKEDDEEDEEDEHEEDN